MKYKELLDQLSKLTPEQLNKEVVLVPEDASFVVDYNEESLWQACVAADGCPDRLSLHVAEKPIFMANTAGTDYLVNDNGLVEDERSGAEFIPNRDKLVVEAGAPYLLFKAPVED